MENRRAPHGLIRWRIGGRSGAFMRRRASRQHRRLPSSARHPVLAL